MTAIGLLGPAIFLLIFIGVDSLSLVSKAYFDLYGSDGL